MEHRATHGPGGMRPHVLSTHLGGRVRVAAGDTVYSEPEHVTQPIGDGLRILVILEGAMRLRAGDAPELAVDGPSTLAVCCDGKAERDQTLAEGRPFRCVLVEIDRQLVAEERGSDPDAFLRATSGCHDTRQLVVNVRRSGPSARAIASQILSCPETRDRDFFRLSKALELTSVVLDGFDAARTSERIGRLGAGEADRIRAARAMLLSSLANAPDMSTLASQSGLNPMKLARGFRRLYGTTPFAMLQEARMERAHRMLAGGGLSVGEVASAIGYTQTHFATLFRKRYGLPPSALLPKGTSSDLDHSASNEPKFFRTQ